MKHQVIQRAIKSAKSSLVVRGKVGAVLFSNSGNAISSACNATFYGAQDKRIFTVHAEQALINKMLKLKAIERYGLKNLNILVVRHKPSIKHLANAKPCKMCESLLKLIGIKTYYTDAKGEIKTLF